MAAIRSSKCRCRRRHGITGICRRPSSPRRVSRGGRRPDQHRQRPRCVLASQPIFTATIAPSQRSACNRPRDRCGRARRRHLARHAWVVRAARRRPLCRRDPGGRCGPTCNRIPILGETALTGSVTLVPETSGVVVPTSALILEPSGGLTVTLKSGEKLPVEVIAEADGFAVVDGLESGAAYPTPRRNQIIIEARGITFGYRPGQPPYPTGAHPSGEARSSPSSGPRVVVSRRCSISLGPWSGHDAWLPSGRRCQRRDAGRRWTVRPEGL